MTTASRNNKFYDIIMYMSLLKRHNVIHDLECVILFSEKISYFIIAFSIYLLGKSILFFTVTPIIYLVFDISMAISLLCSNVPRVTAVPYRYLPLLHKLEYITFAIAIIALLSMIL